MTTLIQSKLMAVSTNDEQDRLMLITNGEIDSDDLEKIKKIVGDEFNLIVDWWEKKGRMFSIVLKEK